MKVMVTSSHIGARDNRSNIDMLSKFIGTEALPALQTLILIKGRGFKSYQQMTQDGALIFLDNILRAAQRRVKPGEICNMQFTSGTTGNPKAAQLSHM
jgi:long-subunit acyl-CoA synthetase (AMP-forming)